MARLADIPVDAAPEVIALGDKALEQMLTATCFLYEFVGAV